MKNLKRIWTLGMAAFMTVGMLSGCGGSGGSGSGDAGSEASSEASSDAGSEASSDAESGEVSTEGASITIFNSKMEIQDQMEEMASEYSEETGVDVEVYYSSDTVSAHLSTRYASNDPYTISMVDAKDVYSLAAEHALDLSDQDWVKNTTQAISIDGKTYGFPVCVEARGIIYNKDAIEKTTGETFDPSTIKTTEDFDAICQKLVDGGMAAPTGIMKEDWSLGAHFLAETYEEQDDAHAFVTALHDGSQKIADNATFNAMMDTFDVLMKYNYAKDAATSAEREVTEQKLAEGEIAFMFGGNWDWSVLNAYDYSENMGMMPVPQNTDGDFNTKLVGGGSKYFFIDSSENTSAAQQQAAKDFLNWLVNEEAGQKFIVETCALVPAFSNITLEVKDPLGKSVKEYADADKLTPNYNYLPDDHYAKTGASFQKYLAGEADRAAFGDEIDSYWASVEVPDAQ